MNKWRCCSQIWSLSKRLFASILLSRNEVDIEISMIIWIDSQGIHHDDEHWTPRISRVDQRNRSNRNWSFIQVDIRSSSLFSYYIDHLSEERWQRRINKYDKKFISNNQIDCMMEKEINFSMVFSFHSSKKIWQISVNSFPMIIGDETRLIVFLTEWIFLLHAVIIWLVFEVLKTKNNQANDVLWCSTRLSRRRY